MCCRLWLCVCRQLQYCVIVDTLPQPHQTFDLCTSSSLFFRARTNPVPYFSRSTLLGSCCEHSRRTCSRRSRRSSCKNTIRGIDTWSSSKKRANECSRNTLEKQRGCCCCSLFALIEHRKASYFVYEVYPGHFREGGSTTSAFAFIHRSTTHALLYVFEEGRGVMFILLHTGHCICLEIVYYSL